MKGPIGDLMRNYLNNPLQLRSEIDEFVRVLKDNNITSYLEIGSMYGGSLWLVSRIMPQGSRIVSVDLPPPTKPYTVQSLDSCIKHLKKEKFDAHCFRGDSTEPSIVKQVRKLGPFDACLIDANHSLPFVSKDWENYGPMCKMVAFHDINYHRPEGTVFPPNPTPGFYAIEVPEFWNEIKNGYRNVEIKHDKRDNGIGIIWK